MNENQALNILVQAVQIAEKRGAYAPIELPQLAQAIAVFAPKPEEAPNEHVQEEVKEDKPKPVKTVKLPKQ